MRGRRPDIDSDTRTVDVVGGRGDLVERDIVGADMKMLEFEIVHRQTMILARFLDLKFLSELAAAMAGPSDPPHPWRRAARPRTWPCRTSRRACRAPPDKCRGCVDPGARIPSCSRRP